MGFSLGLIVVTIGGLSVIYFLVEDLVTFLVLDDLANIVFYTGIFGDFEGFEITVYGMRVNTIPGGSIPNIHDLGMKFTHIVLTI